MKNYKIIKMIIGVLLLVVIALLVMPWFITDPDFKKELAMNLSLVAAGLIVLAIIGFLVNMLDTKIHENRAAESAKTSSPFSDNSLFDAKVRAMHERARRGMHVYPEGHVCKVKISPMEMLLKAIDPDDVLVDCYGNDKEGYRTRFYGSLDGGTTWYELKIPSTPSDRKTMLKVALGLASVHAYANQIRQEMREKIVDQDDHGYETIAAHSAWKETGENLDREERVLHVDPDDMKKAKQGKA